MSTQIKSISQFVNAIREDLRTVEKVKTYETVQAKAKELLGAHLSKEQVWKVINTLNAETITLVDDLDD